MWHVDNSRRIVGQYRQVRALRHGLQAFAGLEHGQGAKQPARVECIRCIVHIRTNRADCFGCPQTCDNRVRDVGAAMSYVGFMFGIEIIDAALLPAIFVALVAGVFSFLSPCVLPIVPPYLAYMSGISIADMTGGMRARRRVFIASLFFVMGLSTVFLLLGFTASLFGSFFVQYQEVFAKISGLVVIVFGLHFIGVFRIGILDQEARLDAGDQGGSAFGAYVLGLAFAFGWTPCIGPQLGAILSLAASEASVARGTFLLGVYAAGLGIPFMLAALFVARTARVMQVLKRHMRTIERIMGALLLIVGIMLVTGAFTAISWWLLEQFPTLATFG